MGEDKRCSLLKRRATKLYIISFSALGHTRQMFGTSMQFYVSKSTACRRTAASASNGDKYFELGLAV
jgi:hypothetical protein